MTLTAYQPITPELEVKVICSQGFLPIAFGDPAPKYKAATLPFPGRGSILTLRAGVPLMLDSPYQSKNFPPSPPLWSSSVTLEKRIALLPLYNRTQLNIT